MSAAAAAAFAGVFATAQAQVLVPIEMEGPLTAYASTTTTSGTMTVMNIPIDVTASTEFVTPTGSRSTILRPNGNPLFNVNQWMRGETFNGRRRPGLLGGTVIVTGEYDTATGRITASEVFSDVAENVILGVITDAQCTTPSCDGPGDYIRGNGDSAGVGGAVFLPNKDPRLTANPLVDAGLFLIDASRGLVGTAAAPTTFGGEGYMSDDKIFPDPVTNPQETALIYWAFELGENRPDLLQTPGVPELSALRIRCTEGGRLESRGFVHSPMTAAGVPLIQPGMPANGGVGRIRVTMTVDGVTTTYLDEDGDGPEADVPAAYGVYRLRQDVAVCGTEANVYWETANGATIWASQLNVPIDRVREE